MNYALTSYVISYISICRCILNKADQVDRQKLLRVYGALMWSLGKVIQSPEALRVYLGSFWDQPLQHQDNAELFEMEERDLMRGLYSKYRIIKSIKPLNPYLFV